MNTRDILARLIAFPTVSRDPNRELIDWVAGLLAERGIAATILPDASGRKASLFASVGATRQGGVLLSGHTDVVPVDGQSWTKPPFDLTEEGGRLYGRGSCDMKGFCAAAIHAMLKAPPDLASPLHLALSHDEEIGCIGVRPMINMLARAPFRPALCIVGEPTSMAVATGHKGKTALRATCTGEAGHSALAPLAMNALHLAVDFAAALRAAQAAIVAGGRHDGDYDVPHTTLHMGRIEGGDSLNIVPARAVVDFEIRNLAGDDPKRIIDTLRARAAEIVARADHPAAAIEIDELWSYPGLDTPKDAAGVAFVRALTGANGTIKVAFGTEGGLFDTGLGIEVVICGPGSMEQGHKADEFVAADQLAACDAMLSRLLERLRAGL